MFWRWRRNLKAWQFNRQIREVLDTPPLVLVDAPWSIVSMVAKHDATMYLLSLKAFYRCIGRGKVVAIIDRDTPERMRRLLQRHIVGISLITLEDIDTGRCQRGGTWERLCCILDRSVGEYTVQLDSDTLPLGQDLGEVVACIEQRRAFTMADNRSLLTMRAAAREAQATASDYIGIAAERLFDRYPGCDRLLYVRGSSGLAGFSMNGFSTARLEAFHGTMHSLLGARWTEWGSEQCGSNFAVANSPDAVVLPYPAYASFGPGGDPARTKFFHFIGTWRFDRGVFATQGRAAIKQLRSV